MGGGGGSVSIAIPAYNEERYIARCLQSLARQWTATELEIIVCLNACTDGTERVVASFTPQNGVRLKLVHEPRKGIARARQRAFEQATGEIILSADADTEYPPDWVERIIADFRRDPGTVLVYGPVRFQSLRGATEILLRYLYPLIDLLVTQLGRIAGRPNVCGANFAVDCKAFWRAGGFNIALKAFEDNDLACRLARQKRPGHIHYDPRLVVHASARRYERYGFCGSIAYYAKGYLKTFILKRRLGEFQEVRAPQSW